MTFELFNRLSKPREGIEESFSKDKEPFELLGRLSSGHPQTGLLPIFISVKGNSSRIDRITFATVYPQRTLNLDSLL